MAKLATANGNERRRKKRPGRHSKNKTSNRKDSKFYRKKYRGQGK